MEVSLRTGTSAYRPLSFCGPSTSMPIHLPSWEKEWQLAQVGSPDIITRLRPVERSINRHAIRGTAWVGSGWISPCSPTGPEISGTSR